MKRFLLAGASAVVLAILPSIASAADDEPHYSWSGFYIGAYAGMGGIVNELESPVLGGIEFDGVGGEGFLAGGMLGYNHQFSDRFVLGIQGDIGFSDLTTEADAIGGLLELDAKPDFTLSASLRAGYLVTPATLLYVIGGYSYAEYQVDVSILGLGFDFDQNYDGFHIGGGLETRLTDRLTARVEYRYTDYSSEDWGTGGLIDVSPSSHTGTLGLAYLLFPMSGSGEYATPTADVVDPVETVDWTGLYIGASAGAGAIVNELDSPILGGVTFDGVGGEGFLGSLMLGFNWQAGSSFVIGIQGDIGMTDMSTEFDFPLLAGLSVDAKPDWFASASLRLGFLPTPDTMIYAIGGYSHAEYEVDIDIGAGGVDFDQSYDGFHVGGGVETMLTDHLTARAEYRYTQYKDEDWGTGGLINVEPSSHTGTLGIAYLFSM
jgi:outer membrane immunogenic protein